MNQRNCAASEICWSCHLFVHICCRLGLGLQIWFERINLIWTYWYVASMNEINHCAIVQDVSKGDISFVICRNCWKAFNVFVLSNFNKRVHQYFQWKILLSSVSRDWLMHGVAMAVRCIFDASFNSIGNIFAWIFFATNIFLYNSPFNKLIIWETRYERLHFPPQLLYNFHFSIIFLPRQAKAELINFSVLSETRKPP